MPASWPLRPSKQHTLRAAQGQALSGMVGQRKVTSAFLLPRVFKYNYMAAILTQRCYWDALSFERTRKNTLLEIEKGKQFSFILQLSLHGQTSHPCFPVGFSGSCVGRKPLSALGRGVNETTTAALRSGRERGLCRDKYKLSQAVRTNNCCLRLQKSDS